MTRSMMKPVGSTLFVALGLAVYVGCGAPPPASEGEREGATSEALSSAFACVDTQIGIARWMVDAKCGCNYSGAAQDQCVYELGILKCLQGAGYALNCANIPPLGIMSVVANDPLKFIGDYEDVDFNHFFPGNCRAQAAVSSCVATLNTLDGPSGTPNTKPTVSAALLSHCRPLTDACMPTLVHADFDPCSTKACTPKQ